MWTHANDHVGRKRKNPCRTLDTLGADAVMGGYDRYLREPGQPAGERRRRRCRGVVSVNDVGTLATEYVRKSAGGQEEVGRAWAWAWNELDLNTGPTKLRLKWLPPGGADNDAPDSGRESER